MIYWFIFLWLLGVGDFMYFAASFGLPLLHWRTLIRAIGWPINAAFLLVDWGVEGVSGYIKRRSN